MARGSHIVFIDLGWLLGWYMLATDRSWGSDD